MKMQPAGREDQRKVSGKHVSGDTGAKRTLGMTVGLPFALLHFHYNFLRSSFKSTFPAGEEDDERDFSNWSSDSGDMRQIS